VLEKFKARFAEFGKARLRLRVTIEEGSETAVEFDGTFVAVK
jgi:hypothetical protein